MFGCLFVCFFNFIHAHAYLPPLLRFKLIFSLLCYNRRGCLYVSFFLRIGSCLACVYLVVDARRKFGEHKRSVKVARGDSHEQLYLLECSPNFPNASITRYTAKNMNQFFYNMATTTWTLKHVLFLSDYN